MSPENAVSIINLGKDSLEPTEVFTIDVVITVITQYGNVAYLKGGLIYLPFTSKREGKELFILDEGFYESNKSFFVSVFSEEKAGIQPFNINQAENINVSIYLDRFSGSWYLKLYSKIDDIPGGTVPATIYHGTTIVKLNTDNPVACGYEDGFTIFHKFLDGPGLSSSWYSFYSVQIMQPYIIKKDSLFRNFS